MYPFINPRSPWSDWMRCCRSDWPGLCLFCNLRVLSVDRVDFGPFCSINPFYPPPSSSHPLDEPEPPRPLPSIATMAMPYGEETLNSLLLLGLLGKLTMVMVMIVLIMMVMMKMTLKKKKVMMLIMMIVVKVPSPPPPL